MTPNELLQARYDRLIQKVRRMRGAQKQFLRYYASQDKKTMKRLEYEVDNLLNEEEEAKKSKQTVLL